MPIPPMVGKNSTTCRVKDTLLVLAMAHLVHPRCCDFGAQTFVDGTQFQSNHLSEIQTVSRIFKKKKLMEMSFPLMVRFGSDTISYNWDSTHHHR